MIKKNPVLVMMVASRLRCCSVARVVVVTSSLVAVESVDVVVRVVALRLL